MELTKTDLEQYQKQAGIVWTAATAKIAQARMGIARWINIDNTNCKPNRLHPIGSLMENAWLEYEKLDTDCRKLAQAKPNEAPTLYSRIITAYEAIESELRTINHFLK